MEIVKAFEREIAEAISAKTGKHFVLSDSSGMGGGCISSASRITGKDGSVYFLKSNSADFLEAFEAEAHALAIMAATRTIRVPLPIATCASDTQSALILEYLPMGRSRSGDWGRMGREFARMHRHLNDQYGWAHDNWIGSTRQINEKAVDWITFLKEYRLMPQINWARNKRLQLREADALISRLPEFFADYDPSPSLLHGDLWSGNSGFLEDGTPVIFDPAAYYGDREADLAMTEMFGGYPPDFYNAYNEEWPLDPGYRQRKQLYILYHTLNHYNIFGGGYGSQAESIIRSLV